MSMRATHWSCTAEAVMMMRTHNADSGFWYTHQGGGGRHYAKKYSSRFLEINPGIEQNSFESPLELFTFDEKGASIMCLSEAFADVMTHIRHGSALALRGI